MQLKSIENHSSNERRGIVTERKFSVVRFLSLLLVLEMCVLVSNSLAATYCVGPSATGSGSGSDWNNQKAWNDTPARGDIWYLRGGTGYGSKMLNVPSSAQTRITIKKAIPADHVTDVGWVPAYGTEQALLGRIAVNASNSGYWTFDGQVGDLGKGIPYGIKVYQTVAGEQTFNFEAGGADSVLRYLDIAGPGGRDNYNHTSDTAVLSSWGGQATNLLVQHCHIHGGSTNIETADSGTIIEHCYVTDSRSSNSAAHSNAFFCGFGASGITFRFNIVSNYNDEGFFITGYGGSPSNIKIYGNVFTSPGTTNPRGIELRQDFDYSYILIYNNTFVNLSTGGILNRTGESGNRTTGSEARNNVTYNAGSKFGDFVASDNNSVVDASVFVAPTAMDFRLKSALAGAVLAKDFEMDMDGKRRGADGVWDRGAYEFGGGVPSNPPVIAIAPISLSFGALTSGSTKDASVTVQNTGGERLVGSVSTAPPFSIVSGNSYDLGAGQTQTVVLRYSPTALGAHSGTATFTGGGGTTLALSGSAGAAGLSLPAISGTISSPFVSTGGYISQATETDVTTGGRATYDFTILTAGNYRVSAEVNAPNEGANSLFLNVDADPTDPESIWDIALTSGFEIRAVSWRGNGPFSSPQFPDKVFFLAPGPHRLIIAGREAGTQVRTILISPASDVSPAPPSNLRTVK